MGVDESNGWLYLQLLETARSGFGAGGGDADGLAGGYLVERMHWVG